MRHAVVVAIKSALGRSTFVDAVVVLFCDRIATRVPTSRSERGRAASVSDRYRALTKAPHVDARLPKVNAE